MTPRETALPLMALLYSRQEFEEATSRQVVLDIRPKRFMKLKERRNTMQPKLDVAIRYTIIREDRTEMEKLVRVIAQGIAPLPHGKNNREIFSIAVSRAANPLQKAVLIELFRYLTFGHFAGDDMSLGRQFSYQGLLPEARIAQALENRSQRTTAPGAALFLLLNTTADEKAREVLAGIIVALTQHLHYKGSASNPVKPRFEEAR